ncbi:hypothetical protein DM860_008390 [Cuscuta australis]|uniref:Uncharacterized protein n=1 Tax=Cuscuta australis TaxID=267555 RepID=A0A328D531_9ASTE|nr:hypothetical protein DM860_008390 [Cuscuta australis]
MYSKAVNEEKNPRRNISLNTRNMSHFSLVQPYAVSGLSYLSLFVLLWCHGAYSNKRFMCSHLYAPHLFPHFDCLVVKCHNLCSAKSFLKWQFT